MKQSDIEVSYVRHCGDDLAVVDAARVSFHKESEWELGDEYDTDTGVSYEKKLKESDAKLIRYLAKHKHTSPFNHSFITVRVKCPVFVRAQLVKHKFMPINEVSRRYVDEEPEFYMPEIRKRAENVKQGSSDAIITEFASGLRPDELLFQACYNALGTYKEFIANGVAPEIARAVLPQNMMTEFIWSGTLNAFCDMLKLRLEASAQYESRIVAEKIRDIITPLFPVSVPALLEQ